jgi:single-strand DNA-binding protein
MNNVSIIGRAVRDPDCRHTTNGVAVTSFTLAVDRPVQKDAEKETDYLPCVAWRSLADFAARYMHKGQRFGVTGSIRTRNYDDKDGKRVYVTEIHADRIYFADGKGGNADAAQSAPAAYNNQTQTSSSAGFEPYDGGNDDDFPF